MDIRERIRKRATGEIDNEAELKTYEKKLIEQQKQEKEEIEERKRIQRAERVNKIKKMSEESNVLPKATRQDVIEHSKKYNNTTNNEEKNSYGDNTRTFNNLGDMGKYMLQNLDKPASVVTNVLSSLHASDINNTNDVRKRSNLLKLNTIQGTFDNTVGLAGLIASPILELEKKIGKATGNESLYQHGNTWQNSLKALQDVNDYGSKVTSKLDNEVLRTASNVSRTLGNMAPSLALSGLTGGAGGTLGKVGSFLMKNSGGLLQAGNVAGNETLRTLNDDNSNYGQASLTGLLKGTIEYGTEKLFGGNILAKGTSLDKLVSKGIANNVKSKAGQYLASKGYEFSGEIAEELISDIGGNFVDKIVNGKELPTLKEWLENAGETAKETFITTAILNILGVGGGTYRDVQGLNLNKQQEAEAQRLTSEARNMIVQELQNNNNNTESINQLPTARSNKKQTNENILPVRNEQKRYSNINYEESAKKYGIDTNNETVKSINRVAQERGITVKFDSDIFESNSTNAIWRNNVDGTREIILNPNADTKRTLQSVITHELTHDFEGTAEYNELKELVLNYDKKNVDFENARKSLEDIYSRVYDKNSNEFQTLVENEAVADILGNKLGDQNFINNLTIEKPSTARKIYNWVIDKLNKINKITGYKSEKIFWADVKNKFENAYKQDYKGNNISERLKFSINPNFKQEYDSWNKVDRQGSFILGKASEALQSIGLNNYDIVMDKTKILNILNKHNEMNDNLIKQIPDILENPTLILKSQTIKGRITVFSEITATDGKPILVAMELNPAENRNNVEKIYKVASAYGRQNIMKMQDWLNDQDNILYIDKQKNRTMNWLSGLGLQLPVPNNLSSSINSIASKNKDVNTTKHSMQESENNTWQEYLDKNYKNTGMGQTIQDVKVAPTADDNRLETFTKKILNPVEISNLKQDDANTTPELQNRRYERGNKLSSFFSNITEDSKFLNKSLREEMAKNDNIQYYKGITNAEMLEKAYNKLQVGGQGEVMEWLSKEGSKATAEDVTEGWILLKQYQDKGDYKSAVEVAKKMRDIGTTAGQTVQAYNILSRLTPEGMFFYAQKELSEAYEKIIEGKSKKWIEENQTKFDLTPEDTQFIKETMQEVSKMEDGYDKKVKLAQIQKVITDKIPSNAGKSLKAWMRISMLFNPKTQVRNIAGNAIIAPVNMFSDSVSSGIDKIISKKTGVRTIGNTNLIKYAKGFGKGLYESYNDFRNGINTRNIDGNRFEVTEGKSFNEKGIGKILNRVDNLLSFMLDAGDRSFYEATFTNSINNQLVLNNKTEVTQDMVDIATTEALQRTWQDNNAYTQTVLSIRNALNGKVGKRKGLEYGLGDILIPFAKTPANLTKAIVDYSPIGLTKSLVLDARKLKNSLSNGQYSPQLQHKTVQNIGKGFAGTFLYIAAYALAKAGIASGEADEDKDVKNFIKNTLGINSYSIKIGDKSFTYDWAQPIAAPLSIMTNIVNSNKKDIALLESIVSNLDSAGSILLEQSFLESINSVLNNNEGFVTGLINEVLELPSRALPTLSKQIADLVDGTQRTTYEYGNPLKSATNTVINKIPGASKTLPAARDTLGNEIKKYGGNNNVWNVMFNPSNTNSEKISNAGKEIYEVYLQTGDTTIFPRTAPYYINNNGEKIIMTSSERSEFQKVSGQYVEKTLNALISDSAYKKLKDTEKSKIINEIVSDSYAKAKYDILKIESEQYKEKRELLDKVSAKTYYNYQIKIDELKKDNEKLNVLIDSNYTDKEKTALYENYIKSKDDMKYDIIKSTGLNINSYLKYKLAESNGEFDSDKEDDGTVKGKTVINSAKNKRYNYINSTNATYTQKLILWALSYEPSSNSEKQLVINYVKSMPNKTNEEKLDILSEFKGVTIYKNGTFDY